MLAKPDPAIFKAALDALGVPSSEAAFVGDSPLNDVAGAQALGIFAVQIGSRTRDGVTPDARIDTLHELEGVLAQRGRAPAGRSTTMGA
jgi:putative hydrolase of the HAD superfamily